MIQTTSILEIIIHRRPLILRHTLLLPIHLRNLPTTRRLIRFLIITNLDESREPQTNTLFASGVNAFLAASFISRTQGQVGGFHFPYVAGLEPYVWLVLAAAGVGVEWFRTVDDDFGEGCVEFFEDLFGEAGADVAYGFVAVCCWVVACKEEGAVNRGSFSSAVVCTEDDEVQGVSYTSEIVLLDLESLLEKILFR